MIDQQDLGLEQELDFRQESDAGLVPAGGVNESYSHQKMQVIYLIFKKRFQCPE